MVGVFLAWVLGGWVSTHYGWRFAFFMAGPPGIVLALLIAWVKVDKTREIPENSKSILRSSTFHELFRNAPFMWLVSGSSLLSFVSIGLVNMIGSFLIRSHGMSISEVGFLFGPVMAVGMACGLVGGGWIGSHLAQRGVDALVWFCTWNAFALFPIYMGLLLAPSKALALAAMFVGATVSTLYSPCFSAAYQTICAPNTRATAAGLQLFLHGLIGGALTPFLVGALSDYWRPHFGENSLKYAMMVGLLACLMSGMVFMHARRLLNRGARDDTDPVTPS
jgi:fucose permease